MRRALVAFTLILAAVALPASAISPQDVLVPEGRISLAASGPITAVAIGEKSIYLAESEGNRVCEYTHAGNLRRCLDTLPLNLGPLEISSLAYRAPEPIAKEGTLYVAAPGHKRIYKVDLRSGRVDKDHLHLESRSLAVADYGLLIGAPLSISGRTDSHAFHRLSRDLRSSWDYKPVRDEILSESPWAPLAVAPDGDVYGAISGKYEIVRYDPRGYARYSFGLAAPIFEDVVPQGKLSKDEWLELWSPVHRLDRIGDSLLVTSRVNRDGRTWDIIDLYSLDGRPIVRSMAIEHEFPIASTDTHLFTLRKDEPGVVLYKWAVNAPEVTVEGGLIATLPSALSPVRAASGLGGKLSWSTLRPYLESAYSVVAVKRSRPVVEFSSEAMASEISGYLEPIGQSVMEAMGRLIEDDLGETLRRNFQRATFDGAGSVSATLYGWDTVFKDEVLATRLRGEVCKELRQRAYSCP